MFVVRVPAVWTLQLAAAAAYRTVRERYALVVGSGAGSTDNGRYIAALGEAAGGKKPEVDLPK